MSYNLYSRNVPITITLMVGKNRFFLNLEFSFYFNDFLLSDKGVTFNNVFTMTGIDPEVPAQLSACFRQSLWRSHVYVFGPLLNKLYEKSPCHEKRRIPKINFELLKLPYVNISRVTYNLYSWNVSITTILMVHKVNNSKNIVTYPFL